MEAQRLKIAVVGLGYVGLSNAALLALENEVVGLDISATKVEMINKGKLPIIDERLESFFNEKQLHFIATTNENKAYQNARYVIVSIPTNFDEKNNQFDTSAIIEVITQINKINKNALIIIKSTVPIGFVSGLKSAYGISNVIFSPEFLREGQTLHDNLFPSRIVIGEKSDRALDFANLISKVIEKKGTEIIFTGSKEAEAIKLFSNSYLAMRVAFFNELDTFSMKNELNTRDIIKGISLDPRIGQHYNNPSFGYGGYCLPKDTKQLLSDYADIPQHVISAIVTSNEIRIKTIAQEILKKRPKIVGIFRLIMKAGSDNFRESAVLKVVKILRSKQIKLIIYEPNLSEKFFNGILVEKSLTRFKTASDLIVSNRVSDELFEVEQKVFTRDLFNSD